eukprot:GEMP01075226.1.p1 GENE.GEMP01075226.1~~GEMP01075226.1.p1  ORF type:complete len:189 (+),score=34.91 GEMP01075226.1:28-594(+)
MDTAPAVKPIIEGPHGTFVEDDLADFREHLVKGNPKCLEKLEEQPDLITSALDAEGWYPLHYCFHPKGKLCQPLIEALLRRRADVNTKAKSGLTPFHLCCQAGTSTLVELMLKTADLKIKAQGKGSMDFALCNPEYITIVELLRKKSIPEYQQVLTFGESSLLRRALFAVVLWLIVLGCISYYLISVL